MYDEDIDPELSDADSVAFAIFFSGVLIFCAITIGAIVKLSKVQATGYDFSKVKPAFVAVKK